MSESGERSDGGSDPSPAIELVGIDKRFGKVHANKLVNLKVARGTIHGIVGENGAGKSTLVSVLYGFYRADAGMILVNGEARAIAHSRDAIAAGIGMVHQHFMLVDTFTVLENLVLGAEGGPLLRAGMERAREEVERLKRDYQLDVDTAATVGDLSVGLQQRVEILKALLRGAQTLILDEPTGVLTPQEADHLFRILAALRDQGKTVILITHKLREIMAITDRVSVMRRGEMVGHRRTADTDIEELAEMMVGRKVLLTVEKNPAKPGKTVFEVKNLRVTDDAGIERVRDVSFAVRAGEIVGVAGVSGNGQSELLTAIAGITPIAGGEVWLNGRVVGGKNPPDARALRRVGLAHVPEDRQRMGLVMPFSAWESTILGYQDDSRYNANLLLDRGAIIAATRDQMVGYDVRPDNPLLVTAHFSGGNQQKIVLAREMERGPDILIVGQPTRGVDIGAIEFIHRRIIALRDAGKAVLLVSVELDEIMSLSDRILVMFDGRLMGEVAGGAAKEAELGMMMAGVAQQAVEVA